MALGLGIGLAAVAHVVPASGANIDPELPHVVCSQRVVADIKGDAAPDYVGGGNTSSIITNNPALDILAVDLRLTADQLQVFLAIDGVISPSTMAAYEASYRYTMTFKFNGKLFTYAIEQRNPSNPAQPLDGVGYPTMNMGTGGDDLPGSTSGIRPGTASTPSWVIFTSPRARIEKNLGGPIVPGDAFTNIYAMTQDFTSAAKAKGDDTTVAAAQAKYVVGKDDCFGPPPTTVGSLVVSPAQWSDSAALSAVLLDSTGKPMANKSLSFAVGNSAHTTLRATTDVYGRATVSDGPIWDHAGSYPVTVQFVGDTAGKPSSATGTLRVTAEVCSFNALLVTKPTAATRVVTATLLDNDRHPVVGVAVDWWVNGKKAATGKTDKAGKVGLRTGKPGQTVQARYAGAPGMLTAAVSKTVKL
jgi:hypothetical protein